MVVVFFILYQQLENHVLQPVVYNRTVGLSPLVILLVRAGRRLDRRDARRSRGDPRRRSIQVLIVDYLRARREGAVDEPLIT